MKRQKRGLLIGFIFLGLVLSFQNCGQSFEATEGIGGIDSGTLGLPSTTHPFPPPEAPEGLTATAVSTSQIDLAWQDKSDTEAGFILLRSLSSAGPFEEVTTVTRDTETYSDSGLAASTRYYYRVVSVNGAGRSDFSNDADATTQTPPTSVPASPTDAAAIAMSATEVRLIWTDKSDNEAGFVVMRSDDGEPFKQITTVGANVMTYQDFNLAASTNYKYFVYATNLLGSSLKSNDAAVRTPAPVNPNVPTGGDPLPVAGCDVMIGSEWDLRGMDGSKDKTICLRNDITFFPISLTPFKGLNLNGGAIDGKGFSIKGVKLTTPFIKGTGNSITIQNLKLVDFEADLQSGSATSLALFYEGSAPATMRNLVLKTSKDLKINYAKMTSNGVSDTDAAGTAMCSILGAAREIDNVRIEVTNFTGLCGTVAPIQSAPVLKNSTIIASLTFRSETLNGVAMSAGDISAVETNVKLIGKGRAVKTAVWPQKIMGFQSAGPKSVAGLKHKVNIDATDYSQVGGGFLSSGSFDGSVSPTYSGIEADVTIIARDRLLGKGALAVPFEISGFLHSSLLATIQDAKINVDIQYVGVTAINRSSAIYGFAHALNDSGTISGNLKLERAEITTKLKIRPPAIESTGHVSYGPPSFFIGGIFSTNVKSVPDAASTKIGRWTLTETQMKSTIDVQDLALPALPIGSAYLVGGLFSEASSGTPNVLDGNLFLPEVVAPASFLSSAVANVRGTTAPDWMWSNQASQADGRIRKSRQ